MCSRLWAFDSELNILITYEIEKLALHLFVFFVGGNAFGFFGLGTRDIFDGRFRD